MHQDEDTLDTWFSSALWPFSTLGWPDKTPELEYFYPTDVLVTGYDIIFFWVIRMVFSALEQTGETPFHHVLIHGLVRDSQGRKMSKSLGNGIDPLEVIDKYGADALRLTLMTGNAPGNDMRFYWERVESSRNFANKIWNASRFIMMNLEGKTVTEPKDLNALCNEDKWILSRLNTVIRDVTENMDKYELGIAVQKVYDFLWDELCDWYIEMAKVRLWKAEENPAAANDALWTLRTALTQGLKLLHPFMPFITEEIYCTLLPEEESIMISDWPVYKDEMNFADAEKAVASFQEVVRGIRNTRNEMNVPQNRKTNIYIVGKDAESCARFESCKRSFTNLAFAKEISQAQIIMFPGGFSAGDEPDGSAKFFATAFQNEKIKEEVMKLLKERDGLCLGICNGFQALIKLGLVPYGEIVGQKDDSPTLTFNTINRHISKMVYTKVVSNKSPWLQGAELGKVYVNPASHGEGRFVAPKEWIDKLFANGQVATQYSDPEGRISMDEEWNINGSYSAIEGITSPDGRILGKMAHSERRDRSVAQNIYGEQDLKIFESGVAYFK